MRRAEKVYIMDGRTFYVYVFIYEHYTTRSMELLCKNSQRRPNVNLHFSTTVYVYSIHCGVCIWKNKSLVARIQTQQPHPTTPGSIPLHADGKKCVNIVILFQISEQIHLVSLPSVNFKSRYRRLVRSFLPFLRSYRKNRRKGR